MMLNFEKIYSRTVGADASLELKPLLKRFYEMLLAKPYNLREIRDATIAVLDFLSSPQGRTDANCRGVDLFICLDDDWENDWSDLPAEFREYYLHWLDKLKKNC